MKLLTVVGARPQFIKAGPVSRALEAAGVEEILVHTGQHFSDNMSEVFFRELGLRPAYANLDIHGGGHGDQTGRMMGALEAVMADVRPDRVLVYGDTNSTLAGALVAVKMHIPVDHVEAGLRSFNRAMPEEINRIVADHVSDRLFAPTDVAIRHLTAEGLAGKAHKVGDVMYDSVRLYGPVAEQSSRILEKLGLVGRDFAVATIHRPSTTDSPEVLKRVLSALEQMAAALGITVVFPVHPRTQTQIQAQGIQLQRILSIDPLGYLDMLRLISAARLVCTDSGGLQKEAFFVATPCITLRDETEWVELVDLGWNHLLPPAQASTLPEVAKALLGRDLVTGATPYGAGNAAELIATMIAGAT